MAAATSSPGSRSSSFRSRPPAASRCRWSPRALLACRPTTDIAPGNIFQNSAIPYKFAERARRCATGSPTTPFRPSWIRTPGRMQNTFANECFIDELAAAAGADPLEFRLKYLDPNDPRGIEVLKRARRAWRNGTSGRRRRRDQQRRRRHGPRHHLCQIRAGAHLCRRGRRGRGRTARPARSG